MYNSKEKLVIYLSIFEFLTLKKQHLLIERYGDIVTLEKQIESDKDYLLTVVTTEQYNQMVYELDEMLLNNYINNFNKMGITLVTIVSEAYPQLLKETLSPPTLLYCKGNVGLLKSLCVAIVGTRRISRYGREVTNRFAYDIAAAGITVVSGLADGVDTCAHRATLDAKGKTIAVLGSGFNNIYPATNIELAKRIIDNNGLLITEYKPNVTPTSYTFPARNRIIAGISRGVLITEATAKSGSMHTKEYALENNRDLFVVPGRITDIYSAGCNQIIKNCQSVMVLSPNEIISLYGKDVTTKNFEVTATQLNFDEQLILDCLANDEVHYEQILQTTGIEQKTLNTTLMRMELMGSIKKLPGNYYSK